MKISTAVRKAAKRHTLLARNGQYYYRYQPLGADYAHESNTAPYAQAVRWRKQAIAQMALELLGYDAESVLIVDMLDGRGSALELANRAVDVLVAAGGADRRIKQ